MNTTKEVACKKKNEFIITYRYIFTLGINSKSIKLNVI